MKTCCSGLLLICFSLIIVPLEIFSQGISINTGGASPDPSAILDVSSITQGLLVPRMTEVQRNAISSPASSLMIYQTDGAEGYYYNSGTPGSPVWQTLGNDNLGNHTATQTLNMSNNLINNLADPTDSLSGINVRTLQHGNLVYAADAGSSDDYAITLSPPVGAYTAGTIVHFKANTANTGTATLNVNSLGAAAIKKNYDEDLDDNDIKAGQLITVIYDGTNWQMLSPSANLSGGGSGGGSSVKTFGSNNAVGSTMVDLATLSVTAGKLVIFHVTSYIASDGTNPGFYIYFTDGSDNPITVTLQGWWSQGANNGSDPYIRPMNMVKGNVTQLWIWVWNILHGGADVTGYYIPPSDMTVKVRVQRSSGSSTGQFAASIIQP